MLDGDLLEFRLSAKIRVYRFANHLRGRVAGSAAIGPGRIAEAALAAAEAEFEKAAEDYPDWVQGHIDRLYDHYDRSRRRPDQRWRLFKHLNDVAHDMRGQGGTFGYALMSQFGESLYQFTRPRETYDDSHLAIVEAHIDAMNAVIKGRIKGDGGTVGRALIESLNRAIEKHTTTAVDRNALPPRGRRAALPPPR